jgi:tetratricopeptide (TPR) repeat protein
VGRSRRTKRRRPDAEPVARAVARVPGGREPSRLVVAALLVVAVVAAYWRVLGSDFVDFDDDQYVTENPHVQHGLDAKAVVWAWTTMHEANWHPLAWMSHTLDWQLWGAAAGGHHATSLALHAANTVLLLAFLHGTTGALWRSALVAALFGLHPLHVESVAWISERKDVLCTCLWLLTLLAYVRWVKRPSVLGYGVVALGFGLALAAKSMAVTLPFTLLLLDYWPLGRVDGRGRRLWRLVLEKVPLLPLAAGSAALTVLAQGRGGAVVPIEQSPLVLRVGHAIVFYVQYLAKMLWPSGLTFFYLPPAGGVAAWQMIACALVVALLTAAAVRARRPPVLVGWLWYLGTLVPVIGLVQIQPWAFADRYTYVPSIGVFLALAWLLPAGRAARPIAAAAIVLLLALGVRTWVQVGHWRDSAALFAHGLSVDPRNPIAHTNLAIGLTARGEVPAAMAHLEQALAIWPAFIPARIAMGNALLESGRAADAIPEFEAALEADPASAHALTNLGFAHVRAGRPAEAVGYYQRALAVDPDFAPAHRNLGAVLMRAGEFDEAIAHFEQAVAGDPHDPVTEGTLGSLLVQRGRTEEGLRHLARAIELRPGYQEAHLRRIQVLVRERRWADAWDAVRVARAAGVEPGEALVRQIEKGTAAPTSPP